MAIDFIFALLDLGSIGLERAMLTDPEDVRLEFVRKHALTSIASVQDGQICRLAGKLTLASEPLIAPLSGRSCAYYEVTLEEYEPPQTGGPRYGGDWGGWAPRRFDWQSQDFYIEDETGRALIRQSKPNVVLDIDVKAKARRFGKTPPELTDYLDRLMARADAPIIRNKKRLRVYEGVLEAGELINVRGLCRWESSSDEKDYRQPARTLTVTVEQGDGMVITDRKV
jgi:hypothetical protein